MIQIRGLTKTFGKLRVLDDLHIDIAEARVTAILGPNGSGKTTLIKSILGMVVPDRGDVLIDGSSVRGQWAYRRNISYMSQIANFPANLRVREVIDMIREIRRQPAPYMDDIVQRLGVEQFWNKQMQHLSGGMRQKVNVLLTFMFDTPIYILDEPTTGLDPLALMHLKELIVRKKAQGKTILVTSHIMGFVEEMAQHIAFLVDGRLYFDGSLEELKRRTGTDTLEQSIAEIIKRNYAAV